MGWFGPYTLNAKGGYSRSPQSPFFSISAYPWTLGFQFYGQWFSFDKALNLYTTDGGFSQFSLWSNTKGLDLGVGVVWVTNDSATSAKKGTLQIHSGVVTEFF